MLLAHGHHPYARRSTGHTRLWVQRSFSPNWPRIGLVGGVVGFWGLAAAVLSHFV